VLTSALKFRNQTDFYEHLAYSSRVNLTLQKALSEGGITFELKIDKTIDNALTQEERKMVLSLPIRREKGKNVTTINGKDYQIKDINAFFDISKDLNSTRMGYSGGGYLQRTIKLLYRAIKDITPKEIGEIIKNGEHEYAEIQKRIRAENARKLAKSIGFLNEAVRLSKARKLKDGFMVKGKSGRVYTVNSDSLATYEIIKGKEDRYICIVDLETRTETDWGLKDALAKRLLMLSHDLKIADQIHTLELTEES
jgi:hypothetical protein